MVNPTKLLPSQGVYVLWLYLPTKKDITVGKLGVFSFEPGVYAYCGSAQKNLAARILRHRRLEKKLHWHIDYFRQEAEYLGEVTFEAWSKAGECYLVKELLKIPGASYPRDKFGSSDCSCPSHLVSLPLLMPR